MRLIRNLSQHFAEQSLKLQQAVLAAGCADNGAGGAAAAAVASSVEEQEAAVGRCFFGAFPSLVVHLRRAEARAAQQKAATAKMAAD